MVDTELNVREYGYAVVVDAKGRLAIERDACLMRRKVLELLAAGRKSIVLSLDRIPTLDPTAIGCLVATVSTARSLGGDVRLVSSGKRFHEVLRAAHMLSVFECYETEIAAVRSFKESRPSPAGAQRFEAFAHECPDLVTALRK
jgi:anti-anti-sigma factor